MVFFLPQVVLSSGDGPGSVEQALDQSPLDLGWMVGVEVQVPVCVRRFPVDGDVQAAIIPPLEQGVKKGESSVLLQLPFLDTLLQRRDARLYNDKYSH